MSINFSNLIAFCILPDIFNLPEKTALTGLILPEKRENYNFSRVKNGNFSKKRLTGHNIEDIV